jgi:hypothetical protein
VRRPVAPTDATPGLAVDHVMGASGTTTPFSSLATAVKSCVSPTAGKTTEDGVTSTETIVAGTIVRTASPDLPPALARTVTSPSPSPVARPLASTVATASSSDDQVTGRSSSSPSKPTTLAVSWRSSPTASWKQEKLQKPSASISM